MAENIDPNQVQDELAKKKKETSTKKLTFDPVTGELIIKNSTDQETKPNEVVVDQIYKDGFFNTFII
ncbi:MAG: hypothetical protein PHT69_17040 [Bacteroidales bacterium]|nr:hypothetical protein [Bacteroidales bacterium]